MSDAGRRIVRRGWVSSSPIETRSLPATAQVEDAARKEAKLVCPGAPSRLRQRGRRNGEKGRATMPMQCYVDDAELMLELAAGRREAIEPLYRRYSSSIFRLAARSLGPEAADDLLQEVFQAVWQRADTFDPRKGTFRSWVFQIAHFRIVNELRRRRRRPQIEPDPDGLLLFNLPGSEPEPSEGAWREYRISSLRSALAELNAAQQQALTLAFFEGFTHEQVASRLNLPLGTVKSRIRFGLQILRAVLAPVLAA